MQPGDRHTLVQLCLDHSSCTAQLQKEDREEGKEVTPFPVSNPVASRGFCLDDVWGPVHTTQKLTIPLFGTVSLHGHTGVWGHCMQVHMLAEPA